MNPLYSLVKKHSAMYWSPTVMSEFKKEALNLGIPGLKDVECSYEPGDDLTITPVFDSDESYQWYLLKYVNTL